MPRRLLTLALAACHFASAAQTPSTPNEAQLKRDRRDLAKEMVRSVKVGLRDPDSLKFRFLAISADARTGCGHFQARNGFGGMAQTQMIIVDYKPVGATKASWAKHCRNLIDHIHFAPH